jgi:hypothetical protein
MEGSYTQWNLDSNMWSLYDNSEFGNYHANSNLNTKEPKCHSTLGGGSNKHVIHLRRKGNNPLKKKN